MLDVEKIMKTEKISTYNVQWKKRRYNTCNITSGMLHFCKKRRITRPSQIKHCE